MKMKNLAGLVHTALAAVEADRRGCIRISELEALSGKTLTNERLAKLNLHLKARASTSESQVFHLLRSPLLRYHDCLIVLRTDIMVTAMQNEVSITVASSKTAPANSSAKEREVSDDQETGSSTTTQHQIALTLGQQVTADNVHLLPPGSVVGKKDGTRLIHLHGNLWLCCKGTKYECDVYDRLERFVKLLGDESVICHIGSH
jgi:hypothetical protein